MTIEEYEREKQRERAEELEDIYRDFGYPGEDEDEAMGYPLEDE